MGATSWTYFTPYTPDVGQALDRLRQETFANGNYQKPSAGWRDQLQQLLDIAKNPYVQPNKSGLLGDVDYLKRLMRVCEAYESGSSEGLSEAEQAEVAQIRRAAELSQHGLTLHGGLFASLFKKKRPPKTIAGVLRQAGEAGTHSILDIRRVARRPEHGVAWPLPADKLLAAFGSTRPTRQQVDAGDLAFSESMAPWQAVYFAIYADGQPVEYAFVGCSGD